MRPPRQQVQPLCHVASISLQRWDMSRSQKQFKAKPKPCSSWGPWALGGRGREGGFGEVGTYTGPGGVSRVAGGRAGGWGKYDPGIVGNSQEARSESGCMLSAEKYAKLRGEGGADRLRAFLNNGFWLYLGKCEASEGRWALSGKKIRSLYWQGGRDLDWRCWRGFGKDSPLPCKWGEPAHIIGVGGRGSNGQRVVDGSSKKKWIGKSSSRKPGTELRGLGNWWDINRTRGIRSED